MKRRGKKIGKNRKGSAFRKDVEMKKLIRTHFRENFHKNGKIFHIKRGLNLFMSICTNTMYIKDWGYIAILRIP